MPLTRDDFFHEEPVLRKWLFHISFPKTGWPDRRFPDLEGCILYDLDPSQREDRKARRWGAVVKLHLQTRTYAGIRWGYQHFEWNDYWVYISPELVFEGCPDPYIGYFLKWLRYVRDTRWEEHIRERTVTRCRSFKEELMMNRWHPSRVEKLLKMGYEIEDM